ncbi:putative phage abortive infection protein [Chitinophaga sp.]|uniref:putative phage abortive infection protein n=1 Tax=Chitinophaga sp. TaxID=1869181 RepID=UPI0031D4D159
MSDILSHNETEQDIYLRYKRKRRLKYKTNTIYLVLGLTIIGYFINWVCDRPSVFLRYPTLALEKLATLGAVGDANGGLMGPPIAIASAILTFLAFFIQYLANWEQKHQFNLSLDLQRRQYKEDKYNKFLEDEKQQKEAHRERIESRFFELIKLHKENVNEIYLSNDLSGRRCFNSMFYEFKSVFDIIIEVKKNMEKQMGIKLKNVDATSMAYNIFFFGIGYNSEKLYESSFNDDELKIFNKKNIDPNSFQFECVKEKLETYKNEVQSLLEKTNSLNKKRSNWPIHFRYKPYDGHANWLGHYYRHLFQTARYILMDKILDLQEKRQYLRTLRAQLSNFEQLLLFYNAYSWFQEEWDQLFTTYRFIKNIPLELADVGIHPNIFYEKEMISLYLKNGKQMLFEGQGDISKLVHQRNYVIIPLKPLMKPEQLSANLKNISTLKILGE